MDVPMMDSTQKLLAGYLKLADMRGVRIVKKSTLWYMRAFDAFIRVVSLGKVTNFMTGYVSTFGHTIAVPDDWDLWADSSKLELLAHELTHVDQAELLTLPVHVVLYALCFFPMGLAYYRYRCERQAYVNGYRVTLQAGNWTGQTREAVRAGLVEHAVDQLSGPGYLWAWPFKSSMRRWFTRELAGW